MDAVVAAGGCSLACFRDHDPRCDDPALARRAPSLIAGGSQLSLSRLDHLTGGLRTPADFNQGMALERDGIAWQRRDPSDWAAWGPDLPYEQLSPGIATRTPICAQGLNIDHAG